MIEKLKGKIPDSILSEIEQYEKKWIIKTPLQLAHFLAQCAHESAGFKVFVENLNYSEVGLMNVFKKYFTADQAKKYARNPEKIANRVYANRMGNGNEASGDGYKYRGRGAIQLTGYDNYLSFAKWLGYGINNEPNLVATKYPIASAIWFFEKNKLFDLCKDASESTLVAITKRVNGGTKGLEDRRKYFNIYYPIIKEEDKPIRIYIKKTV